MLVGRSRIPLGILRPQDYSAAFCKESDQHMFIAGEYRAAMLRGKTPLLPPVLAVSAVSMSL